MAGINDLPIELYEKIFINLSINDLLNCRLVNKKFKYSTYECVYKLIIVELDDYNFLLENGDWFYNNELINEDDIIDLNFFTTIKSIFNLKKSLKHLKIYNSNFKNRSYKEFVSNNLNNFINLESLEIRLETGWILDPVNYEQMIINSKNLKYYSVDYPFSSNQLNVAKLEKFKLINNPITFSIGYPESIKHLIANCFSYKYKKFKNLEIIELIKCVSEFDENFLFFFNNLKQLKIDYSDNYYNKEKSMIKILNSRTELNKDIDIYLYGVKILNIEKMEEKFEQKLEQIRNIEIYLTISNLDYQIKNYDLLDLSLPRIIELEFSKLNNHYHNLKNDLPSTFFDKYQNISSVYVSSKSKRFIRSNDPIKPFNSSDLIWFLNNLKYLKKLKLKLIKLDENFLNSLSNTISHLSIESLKLDQQNLILFLKNLKCLKKLSIRSLSLDQNFFDNLSNNTIRCLKIYDHYYYDSLPSLYSNINFDFILKLSKLIKLVIHEINHIQPIDLLLKCFSNLKYFSDFRFHSVKMRYLDIQIEKKENYFFFIILEHDDKDFSYVNGTDKFDYDEFVDKCREYKSFVNRLYRKYRKKNAKNNNKEIID